MTEKLEQVPETYDEMFRDGGFAGIFDLPYKSSPYLPMFKEVLGELKRNGAKSVMEVGCGTGAFAHLLLDTTNMAYRGFDFSGVAVDRAKKRFGKPDLFFQGDARDAGCYDGDFDAIVCTEVLEHVVEDLDVVSIWPADRLLVCSVPNFDAATHERFFRTEDEVTSRYG
jgi:SAM-dependent methyltransferase